MIGTTITKSSINYNETKENYKVKLVYGDFFAVDNTKS